MSNTIIPEYREKGYSINRSTFLAALRGGVAVDHSPYSNVDVVTEPLASVLFTVTTHIDTNGHRSQECDCSYAMLHGPFSDGDETPVCWHILIARWHRMDAATKAAILATDPEIAQAVTAPDMAVAA